MQQSSKDEATRVLPLSMSGGHEEGDATRAAGTGPRQVLAGRYEVLGLVGVGGMGSVYRARDLELDEIVAVKVLRPELSVAPGVVERFRREVRLSRKVTHPNVARVFDIGEHAGDKFLTMEFIDGESLAALLGRERRLDVARAVEITERVCAGLGAAHRAGVIHRDLKPDNVLLGRDGRVALTDFGIARAIEGGAEAGKTMGAALGTPAYMAPEQVQGAADIDARADLYALGAMLYEMLTGERAWKGDAPLAVASARLVEGPPDPRHRRADLPDALVHVVLRCMARSRDDRYASVELVAHELAALTVPVPQRTPSAPSLDVVVRAFEPHDKSVAVLPFVNQGAPADAHLAEELTDDLIDTLSMTRGLRVRPRGAVARWKDGEGDPREIGRELGVQVVAMGSVRRRGGTVRISARLVSVADGFQLWAKRFDRPELEVLRINDEVAEAVAGALTVDAVTPNRRAPSDPLAIDLFLRGRQEYRRFWPEHQARAIALFEQALARAPDDPVILSTYALARCRYWFFTGQGGDAAEQAASRALAAAPELADARLAMAAVRFQRLDVVGAVRELNAALARQAENAGAEALLATILLESGAIDEGIRLARSALARDPDEPIVPHALSRAYALLGQWPDAEALIAAKERPEGRLRPSLLALRYALWRREAQRVDELVQRVVRDEIPGARVFARAIDEVLRDRLPGRELVPGEGAGSPGPAPRGRAFVRQIQAEIAGAYGKPAIGVAALELSLDDGLFDLFWLDRCPALDPLRDEPRFGAIHAEVARRAGEVLAAYHER